MSHPFDALQDGPDRDRWGRPLIKQPGGSKAIAYTRASTLGKVLEEQSALTAWKQRMTLVGATLQPHIMISAAAHRDDKQKLNDLAEQAMQAAQAQGRAEIGTALHKITQTIDEGGDPGPYPQEIAADVTAYRQATAGWKYEGLEEFVVCDELQVAGSFDRLRRLPDGRLRIVDLKTGSSVDYSGLSFAVQLAIYAHGQRYDFRTGQRAPLGDVDLEWATVVHLPAGEGRCVAYRVNIAQGWEAARTAIAVKAMRNASRKWLEVEQAPPLEDLIATAASVDDLTALWSARGQEFTSDLTDLAKARYALLSSGAA